MLDITSEYLNITIEYINCPVVEYLDINPKYPFFSVYGSIILYIEL